MSLVTFAIRYLRCPLPFNLSCVDFFKSPSHPKCSRRLTTRYILSYQQSFPVMSVVALFQHSFPCGRAYPLSIISIRSSQSRGDGRVLVRMSTRILLDSQYCTLIIFFFSRSLTNLYRMLICLARPEVSSLLF